jgi:predicted transposase YbfD/YdcC
LLGFQRKPPCANGFSNLLKSISFLKTLVLEGKVIVGDAMFCQREVCQNILDSGGDYLIVVKDNQPTLLRGIASAFADTKAFSPLGPTGIRALL